MGQPPTMRAFAGAPKGRMGSQAASRTLYGRAQRAQPSRSASHAKLAPDRAGLVQQGIAKEPYVDFRAWRLSSVAEIVGALAPDVRETVVHVPPHAQRRVPAHGDDED